MQKLQPFIESVKTFFQNKTNVILAAVILFLVGGSLFAANFFLNRAPAQLPIEEIDLAFDAEGPYAILEPRRDGDAVSLNVYRVGSYEEFSYELVYQSLLSEVENTNAEEGVGRVDRAAGNLNTYIDINKKSEFTQEILFGTCSQGYTSGAAHCVFDKGVENGTLTWKIKKPLQKGDKTTKIYRMFTSWHLQKPDVALGVLTSADSHFSYKTDATREELTTTGYTVINDLSGAPKLPEGKQVFGKVYALNVPKARSMSPGEVSIETLENPPADAKIFYYSEGENKWTELQTSIENNKLNSQGVGAGIYAVLVNNS